MPKTFATLIDETEQELQDSSNALWTAAELGVQLEDAIREISEYDPFIARETYEFETRTGKASSTTAGALVDATETQFRATDVNKVVFNITDRTWAVVTAYVSTSQLTLSLDIMVSGEEYKMYNRECWNQKQLYIGDVEDYVGDKHGVIRVEYQIDKAPRRLRNFTVEGNILTIDINFNPPDSKSTNLKSREVEVYVFFQKKHQVSQLTDLAGAVDLGAGYAADISTIHVDGLAATEVIAEDTEFTIAGLRGRYQTTAATTLAANEGDITFFPPLLEAIVDDDVVTFTGSTLTRKLERLVVGLTAGRAAISKAATLLQQANDAITNVDLMNTRVDVAIATLDSSRTLINTVTKGGPGVAGQYAGQSGAELGTMQGFGGTAASYLAITASAREYTRWGEDMVARILQQLQRGRPPTQFRVFSKA